MRLITMFPPNWRKISAAFDVRGKKICFCYGDTIYSPTGWKPGPSIIVHEEVHRDQQQLLSHPDEWWDRYIEDPAFRLSQEVPAHRAEYRDMAERGANDRELFAIIERLTSPLYGSLVGLAEATTLIA